MRKNKTKQKIMKERERRNNNNLIFTLIALVAVFFISFYFFRGLGTIEYQGLTFTKENIGKDLTVYHYYYLYMDKTGQLIQNNIYLRENPKKNDVPIEGSGIVYLPKKFTYVSINATALENCSNSAIALSELSGFLANGGLQVRGAVMNNDSAYANITNYVGLTCENEPYNTVIQINSGNQTKITIDGLCNNIEFSQCSDVIPAVEKFIVQSILDAKEASKT